QTARRTYSSSRKWQLHSKTKWIEQGEKSTKYFFSKYKSRKSHSALSEIKNPLNITQNKNSTLSYIREEYSKIYKKEEINLAAANEIIKEASQVTGLQNSLLTQEISLEEIRNTIRSLPNNKSPGSDGLTYEFYKLTEEVITPLLHNLFNQVLLSGLLPKSWC